MASSDLTIAITNPFSSSSSAVSGPTRPQNEVLYLYDDGCFCGSITNFFGGSVLRE
jgi:hypothetical protein